METVIRRLSNGPSHHFFGYYGINPWNATGKLHLALETSFHDRRPAWGDRAAVGLCRRDTGEFTPFAETPVFNLQQGAMLGWINAGHGEEFVYNDYADAKLCSKAVNPLTGAVRKIEQAVAALAPGGRFAMGLNYVRNFVCRKVVGYDVGQDPDRTHPCPADDGIWKIDLETGKAELFLSVDDVVRANPMPQTREGPVWLDHVLLSPDAARIFFMCRVKKPEGGFLTSVWTSDTDTARPVCHVDYRYASSHFDWRDSTHFILSTDLSGQMGFLEFDCMSGEFVPFGAGIMPRDGHACFSPDRNRVLCDRQTRMDGRKAQELFLYGPQSGERISLGFFDSPDFFSGDIRCDLHPRFDGGGGTVTFDSIHEGSRQIYMAQLSDAITK